MYCKCEAGSHNSVYAWHDGVSVLICSQCQQLDEQLTNHYIEMRMAYKNNKKKFRKLRNQTANHMMTN